MKQWNNETMREEVLIDGILRGSESLLRQFYQAYSPKLTNFIRQRVSSETDAEELVQDTFLATIEGLRDFTYRSSLYTYMCGIAKRKVIDHYRKKKLKRIVFSRIPAIEPLLAIFTTPEDKLDEKLLTQKIKKTFSQLSPLYRKLLHLKYIEEWPVQKIAKEMEMSFKSVESMIFRARKAFTLVYTDL